MMKERLNEINEKLNDSNVFKNNDEYGNLMNELKNLHLLLKRMMNLKKLKTI